MRYPRRTWKAGATTSSADGTPCLYGSNTIHDDKLSRRPPSSGVRDEAGGTAFPQPVFLDNDTTLRVPGISLRVLTGGLASRDTSLWADTRNETLRTWIHMILTQFSAYSTPIFQVMQNFLEVLLIPTRLLQKAMERLDKEPELAEAVTDLVEPHSNHFRAPDSCRFFLLEDDTMGLVGKYAELGDLIFVPCGAAAPIVVRETEMKGKCKVICVCYVHGIMRGELFDGTSKEKHEMTTIDLV